jgi:hypothetical protein
VNTSLSINRRLFLRHTAVAGVGATIASPAAAEPVKPLTPDERITAAIAEIRAAYHEKWPDTPVYSRDCDNIDRGMVIVMSRDPCSKDGSDTCEVVGTARRHERNG